MSPVALGQTPQGRQTQSRPVIMQRKKPFWKKKQNKTALLFPWRVGKRRVGLLVIPMPSFTSYELTSHSLLDPLNLAQNTLARGQWRGLLRLESVLVHTCVCVCMCVGVCICACFFFFPLLFSIYIFSLHSLHMTAVTCSICLWFNLMPRGSWDLEIGQHGSESWFLALSAWVSLRQPHGLPYSQFVSM